MAEPTALDLRRALPGALAWYFNGDTDLELRVHVEQELRGVIARVAQDARVWERQLVAERLPAALGVTEQAARIRSAPPNTAGEVVYMCALPSDPFSWLAARMEDEGDVVTVALPVADELLWTMQFGTTDRVDVGRTVADVGYSTTTTLGEIMKNDTAARRQIAA